MTRLLLAAAMLVSAIAAPGPARAQVTPAPSAPGGGAEAAADGLVEQAAHAYDQNRLDEALDLLARAHALSARPSILYNQAQVWRAKDDCGAALDAYSRFIDATTADDPNRARATRWRTEMQACVDRRKAEAAAPAAPVAVATPEPAPAAPPRPSSLTLAASAPAQDQPAVTLSSPAPSPRPDESDRRRRKIMRVAGWSLVGAGVVLAGVATAFAWQAHHDQDQLDQKISSKVPWDQGPQSLADEGQRDASWARWLGAAAAVAGCGGVALLIVSRPPSAGVVAGQARAATPLLGWAGTF